jgi:hypothetical protein
VSEIPQILRGLQSQDKHEQGGYLEAMTNANPPDQTSTELTRQELIDGDRLLSTLQQRNNQLQQLLHHSNNDLQRLKNKYFKQN